MKNRFIIPIFIIFIGILAIGYSSGKLSPLSYSEEGFSRNNEIKVATKVISDDTDQLETNIMFPVFSGNNNLQILDKINRIFEKDVRFLKEELLDLSTTHFENSQKENVDFRKYELLIDYEVHTINKSLLSVTVLNYQYTGGAHGLSVKVPYNFDLATGKEIYLPDLFKEKSYYKDIIDEEIQKQIREQPDLFFPDEVEVFSGINENQPFYIKDGKLFIYFGQYDIAPYSSGIIDFEIPSNILKNVVSSSFIK